MQELIILIDEQKAEGAQKNSKSDSAEKSGKSLPPLILGIKVRRGTSFFVYFLAHRFYFTLKCF